MKPLKIYISGKVTGELQDQCSMKFGTIEKQILDMGHTPICPLNLCNWKDSWEAAMKKCIVALMDADYIYMLPDWRQSRGAIIEADICNRLGIPSLSDLKTIQKTI